jgi:CRP/FNR family cyclic AMP-dependent transcriptional regulator
MRPDINLALKLLSHQGWLASQAAAFRKQVVEGCNLVEVARRTSLLDPGDSAGGIYGIVSGSVSVSLGSGKTRVRLALLTQPGWWFGADGFLTSQPRRVGIDAVTDCTLAYLPLQQMEKIASEHPVAVRNFAQIADLNLDLSLRWLEALRNPDAVGRLASVLWRSCGGRSGVLLEITQAELGQFSNVSRKVALAVLKRLSAVGALRQNYRSIQVVDAEMLRSIAYGESVTATLAGSAHPLPSIDEVDDSDR